MSIFPRVELEGLKDWHVRSIILYENGKLMMISFEDGHTLYTIFWTSFFYELGGSHTEVLLPVAVSRSNKAMYHLRTKQIHLYSTSYTGAMQYPISDVLLYCLVI